MKHYTILHKISISFDISNILEEISSILLFSLGFTMFVTTLGRSKKNEKQVTPSFAPIVVVCENRSMGS